MRDVNIPALGMAMTEAVLTRWHKQPGDDVAAGEVVAEIETDKTNMDLESPATGILGRHLADEGEAVPVGSAVVRVLAPGESEETTGSFQAPEEDMAAGTGTEDMATGTEDVPHGDGAAVDEARQPGRMARYDPPSRTPHALSPRKRRLARLEAEAEAFFAVTGEGGPTQAREAAAASAPTPAGQSTVPPVAPPVRGSGRYRAVIAERVAQSWREIPHFAVQREVEAQETDSVLAAVRERDRDATLTDLLLRAYAVAIRDVGGEASGDVGLAVATPDGVLVPVVADVPDLDVSALVTRRVSAVRRAREGKLSPRDLTSSPVGSLSNLGARGVDAFTGIIPLQQQLLLTVGRVRARPVVVDGRLTVRTTVIATLNVDHRRFDGDQAAAVLVAFERELAALRGWAEGQS